MSESKTPSMLGPKIILSLVSLLLAWGVAELAVRILFPNIGTVPPPVPEHLRLPWIAYDPVVGWVNKPGFDGRQVKSNQFDVAVTIDARGVRASGELAGEPTTRILVLGDSFTFGHGVNNPETFSAALQARRKDAEVMNAGCVGTGHDQHVALAMEWLKPDNGKPRPNVIVWGFSSADIPRNTVAFRRLVDPTTGLDYGKPRFALRKGKLVLGNVPTPAPDRVEEALQAHLAAREAARWGVSRFLRRSRIVKAAWDLAADKAEQMPLARAIAAAFVEECKAKGVRLVVVNLPVRRWLDTRNPLNILKRNLTDNLLQDLAKKHGAEVVDCTPAFLAQPDLDALFIQDGHYSPSGHAVVATVIAEQLDKGR